MGKFEPEVSDFKTLFFRALKSLKPGFHTIAQAIGFVFCDHIYSLVDSSILGWFSKMAKDLCFQFKHLLLRMPTLAKSSFLCNLSLLLSVCYHTACIPMSNFFLARVQEGIVL